MAAVVLLAAVVGDGDGEEMEVIGVV
ncbi:hypothetical protein Tco_0476167, partial [Tanacetum coccineum]